MKETVREPRMVSGVARGYIRLGMVSSSSIWDTHDSLTQSLTGEMALWYFLVVKFIDDDPSWYVFFQLEGLHLLVH